MTSNAAYTTDRDELAANIALEGLDVLDIGSGTGGLVRWMRKLGARPVGAECGPSQLAEALAKDPEHVRDYVDAPGQNLPFADGSFDVVTFIYSLHHVPAMEMNAALGEARRVLRSSGTLWVAEPIATGPGHEVDRVIDDETEVRALAQGALDAAAEVGLSETANGQYLTQYLYADFAGYEKVMVGVDPDRAARMAEQRELAAELFARHGTVTEFGVAFDQPVTWRSFAPAG